MRVDPERSDALLRRSKAIPMVMRGREMQGWLRVGAADVRTKRPLERWVTLGTEYAALRPPKG